MAIFRYIEDSWVVDNDGETVATIPDGPQQGAKGRRCAAALNETWGISTKALEAGAVAGLVEAARKALTIQAAGHRDSWMSDSTTTIKVLNDALAALEPEPNNLFDMMQEGKPGVFNVRNITGDD